MPSFGHEPIIRPPRASSSAKSTSAGAGEILPDRRERGRNRTCPALGGLTNCGTGKSRSRNFPIKLLALMASLCFGIASVAVPKEINDEVQYPLYALSAASLYLGFRRKRR